MTELGRMLKDSESELRKWRKSSARAGADEALAWVLSWYEDLDIKSITGQRDGSKWETDPVFVKKRQAAAYAMSKWAKTKKYIPAPIFATMR